ncbi:hypothetical protein D6827_02240 [Candidatus Parcubacteria bacterium]|nr:MAG: hypothetical protein D6827_02240 [Candidatus Parcubacteria bacterium]
MKIFLLQFRQDRVMADHEFHHILEKGGLSEEEVERANMFFEAPEFSRIAACDALILGGSGELKLSKNTEPKLNAAAEKLIKQAWDSDMPIFGICYGAQILAKSLGGEVTDDVENGEVGTFQIYKKDDARKNNLLSSLPDKFAAQLGHEDIISRLPEGARNLAYSDRCAVQFFDFPGRDVYGSTFHPELDKKAIHERVDYYQQTYGWSDEKARSFKDKTTDAPLAPSVLRKFVEKIRNKAKGEKS